MQGQVVGAVQGARTHYRPIQSVLTPNTEPGAIVEALLKLAEFPILYLADLDALMGHPLQSRLIVELCMQHKEIEFWVDAGPWSEMETSWPANCHAILGTEYADDWPQQKVSVLSLDFNEQGLMGGRQIWKQPQRWPEQVIVMGLHRVGSLLGPDWELLRQVRTRAPDRRWIAAGGVRGRQDLEALFGDDYDALIASALHNGEVTHEDLHALQ